MAMSVRGCAGTLGRRLRCAAAPTAAACRRPDPCSGGSSGSASGAEFGALYRRSLCAGSSPTAVTWEAVQAALPGLVAPRTGNGRGAGGTQLQRRSVHSPAAVGSADAADGEDILESYAQDTEPAEDDSLNATRTRAGEEAAAASLSRRMWSSARRGVRCEEVWAKYAQRVLQVGTMMEAKDVATMFFAFARIKYRDKKVLDFLSPHILQNIESFTAIELVLLMNAHKKLEYKRLDNIRLLVTTVSARAEEWTGRHVALASNAVAHFYIYEPSFWRLVAKSLPKLAWSMNPLELSNLVAAMARVDRRDWQSLRLIARMCKKCAAQNLFSQETLAISLNAFAKLDVNNHGLSAAFEGAVLTKVDQALAIGSDYRRSGGLRDEDVFDVQALVLVTHSLVCMVGASDEVITKLLTLVSWSADELSDFQRRTLKTTCIILRRQHAKLCKKLPLPVRDTLYNLEKSTPKLPTKESRWARELRQLLQKMDLKVETKPVVDDQVLDILIPTSNSVVYPLGPYAYYAGGTHRTAYSKLHQRLLKAEGYSVMVVPYFEWTELRTDEDKMVYLWSMGRRAAAQQTEELEAASPADDMQMPLESDLSDVAGFE